jgi:hypothetical protein
MQLCNFVFRYNLRISLISCSFYGYPNVALTQVNINYLIFFSVLLFVFELWQVYKIIKSTLSI